MISLNVYLTPNAGKGEELESAIRDKWLTAMVEQPGFVSAAMVKPFSDDELAALEATKPQSAYEVVSYWNTEAERVAWTQRPIHNEVWEHVVNASESVAYTVHTVEQAWNL